MIYVFDPLFMPLCIVNYIIITFDIRIIPNILNASKKATFTV